MTEERMSDLTVKGKRLTWKEAAEHYRELHERSATFVSILMDLDRCEHGRHQGDACNGCIAGFSFGNPLLPRAGGIDSFGRRVEALDRQVGFDMAGRAICVPERDGKNEPTSWREPY